MEESIVRRWVFPLTLISSRFRRLSNHCAKLPWAAVGGFPRSLVTNDVDHVTKEKVREPLDSRANGVVGNDRFFVMLPVFSPELLLPVHVRYTLLGTFFPLGYNTPSMSCVMIRSMCSPTLTNK